MVRNGRFYSQDNTIDQEDIIHGDIKPENVLIFESDPNRYVAKVADFGYSTRVLSDDELVNMPRTAYWVAPEWHHRGFTTAGAMKMDMYSFGMLCLWVLFYNIQGNVTCDFRNNLDSAKAVSVLATTAVAGLDDHK